MGKFAFALIFMSVGAVFGCSNQGDDSGGGPETNGDGDGDGDQGEPAVCQDNDDCSDDVFCNGEERCNPDHEDADAFGCIVAAAAPCGAGNTCNEAGDSCGCEDPDVDGDGFDSEACGGDDCDDNDANRYPGNEEVCDTEHHDEDCDFRTYGFRDQDGDGDPDDRCCNEDESGDLFCGTDCNDNRGNQHSFNTEICDDVDNDCDGLVDETIDGDEDDGLKIVFTIDEDGDGRGSDAENADTVLACDPPEGYVETADDCDDNDNQVSPESTEVCDDVDNDCDGLTDESIDGDEDDGLKTVFTVDADGDGFGSNAEDAVTILACKLPSSGYSMSATDCDDAVAAVNPGAIDSCNDDVDNDCSGVVNDPVGGCACEGNATQSCAASGSVGKCATFTQQCNNGVWGDCPLGLNSEPEVCDAVGVDENCDGVVNNALGSDVADSLKIPYYRDRDGDGYPNLSESSLFCPDLEPAGWTTDENPNDCVDVLLTTNPRSADIHPGAVEVCNGVDDDCDSTVDDVADLESAPSPPNVSALMCGGSDGWEISACSGSYLNCQTASLSDGCETPGNTLANCGDCGNSCSFSCQNNGGWGCVELTTVSAGNFHSCGIDEQGHAYCWGRNDEGRLGSNTGGESALRPDRIEGFEDVRAISSGRLHSCAIAGASNTVHCWGSDADGQLGNGSGGSSVSPVALAQITGTTSIAAGYAHTCAVHSAEVKCWGLGTDGRLGDSSVAVHNSVSPNAVLRAGYVPVTNGAKVVVGERHSCMLTTSGTVECWGDNQYGQLGIGGTTDSGFAVDVGLSSVTSLSAGQFHTCAVSGGKVYCWGRNAARQLGIASGESYDTPQLVPNLTSVTLVAAGGSFTCSVSSGQVSCWGINDYGQRGDSSGSGGSETPTTLALSEVVSVASGNAHACAVTQSPQAVCWGRNDYGQLGNGASTVNPNPAPTNVPLL